MKDMELKEFIKTAIADITNAVSELQGELKNGVVFPSAHVKASLEAMRDRWLNVFLFIQRSPLIPRQVSERFHCLLIGVTG